MFVVSIWIICNAFLGQGFVCLLIGLNFQFTQKSVVGTPCSFRQFEVFVYLRHGFVCLLVKLNFQLTQILVRGTSFLFFNLNCFNIYKRKKKNTLQLWDQRFRRNSPFCKLCVKLRSRSYTYAMSLFVCSSGWTFSWLKNHSSERHWCFFNLNFEYISRPWVSLLIEWTFSLLKKTVLRTSFLFFQFEVFVYIYLHLQDIVDKLMPFLPQLSDFVPLRNGFYNFRAQID